MTPPASPPSTALVLGPEGRGLPELYRIGKVLARLASIDDALIEVAPVVQDVLGPRRVQIIYRTSEGVRCVAWDDDGILARVERPSGTGAPDLFEYFIGGAQRRSRASYPPPSGPAGESSIVLPLVVARSPVFGLVEIARPTPFGEEDLVFASALVNDLAVAIERHATVVALRGSLQQGEQLRSELEMQRAEAHSARWVAEWLTARYEGLMDRLGGSFLWIASGVTLSATYLSAGVEPILGFHRAELLGPGQLLRVVHPDDREGFEGKLRAALTSGQPDRFMHRAVTAEGETRWLLTEVQAAAHKSEMALYGASADVTELHGEREQLARKLGASEAVTSVLNEAAVQNTRLLEALQAAVVERQEILAVVSHDLRTPLTNVMLSARLLREPGDTGVAALDIIERAVAQMDRMLKDLQDVSSIEAGRLSIAKSPVSLRDLCDEACQGGSLVARERSIRFECRMPESEVTVVCDRERILQVLGNFLSNAFKFTPPGGRVTLTVSLDENDARFEVADTGPGMDEAASAKVFERYWQATSGGGRGLGLHIASGIVAAHGGQIGVRSELGAGSTFFFRIPVREDAVDRAAAPSLAKVRAPLESNPNGQRRTS